jgi:hypothetical protein
MGLVAAYLAGCGETAPFEQAVSVVLTPGALTAAVGEEVSFQFDARGTALVGVIFDFGDTVVDSVELFGATEATGTRFHAFGTPGTFEVAATAQDAVVGAASDTATVTVTP